MRERESKRRGIRETKRGNERDREEKGGKEWMSKREVLE